MIYLDYAADTPACEAALSAFVNTTKEYGANPNSGHALGQLALKRLHDATAHIAEMLLAEPSEIVLSSGATEANNLAILGAARAYQGRGRHLITSPMEHASVTAPMMALKSEGFELDFVKVLSDGQVDIHHLKTLLRPDTVLLSLCAVDSEVGVIQPFAKVWETISGFPNCRLHVDATQAVGKLPVDLSGIDLVTLSPHKFYGITGSGALIVRGGLRLTPLWYGGTGATPYRSGTPALSLAVAMEAALEDAFIHLDDRLTQVTALHKILQEGLATLPYVILNSPEGASPYILNFTVSNIRARDVIEQLSQRGICVSSKSACCAPAAPSHPVMAMTGDRKRAMNTVRVSISHLTTENEIHQFLQALRACVEKTEA